MVTVEYYTESVGDKENFFTKLLPVIRVYHTSDMQNASLKSGPFKVILLNHILKPKHSSNY